MVIGHAAPRQETVRFSHRADTRCNVGVASVTRATTAPSSDLSRSSVTPGGISIQNSTQAVSGMASPVPHGSSSPDLSTKGIRGKTSFSNPLGLRLVLALLVIAVQRSQQMTEGGHRSRKTVSPKPMPTPSVQVKRRNCCPPRWAVLTNMLFGSGRMARSALYPRRRQASDPCTPPNSSSTTVFQDQVVLEFETQLTNAARGHQIGGDTTLHVVGAAAVQPAIFDRPVPPGVLALADEWVPRRCGR